jgi:fructose/tagatose bisphosphate aldolase
LEAAKKAKSPVIIQVSNGGGAFMVGKAVKDSNGAAIGSVALAMHIRSVAAYYGIPVVIHSDHCAKKVSSIYVCSLVGFLRLDLTCYYERFTAASSMVRRHARR